MVCSHETPECRCAYYWQGVRAVYKPGFNGWDVSPEDIARQLARRARFLRVAADAMLSQDELPLFRCAGKQSSSDTAF